MMFFMIFYGFLEIYRRRYFSTKLLGPSGYHTTFILIHQSTEAKLLRAATARDLSPSEPLALDDSKKQLPASPRAPKIKRILRPLPRKAKTLTFSPSGNWRVFVNPQPPSALKIIGAPEKGG